MTSELPILARLRAEALEKARTEVTEEIRAEIEAQARAGFDHETRKRYEIDAWIRVGQMIEANLREPFDRELGIASDPKAYARGLRDQRARDLEIVMEQLRYLGFEGDLPPMVAFAWSAPS